MAKLTPEQIEEYFDVHLPYRTLIMLAHFRMTRVPWRGDVAQLQASFEASLITGRMYLNVLGIIKDWHDKLVPNRFRADDVSAEDLGGTLVDPGTLSQNDQDLLIGFHRMVDKGAAHLTIPMSHPVSDTHTAIHLILELVKSNLYDRTGRPFRVT